MIRDTDHRPIVDGAACTVVSGTHKGRSGIATDLNISKTGHGTVTIRQADATRFKTLARNIRITSD